MPDKIVTLQTIKEKIETYRCLKPQGRIGVVPGVFDLLHSGHIELIQEAKKDCDFLIVALTSDQDVKVAKGKDRPYYSQEQRSKIISALEDVDAVVVCDSKNSGKYSTDILLEFIDFEVAYLGPDYKEKISQIIGAGDNRIELKSICIENPQRTSHVENLIKKREATWFEKMGNDIY